MKSLKYNLAIVLSLLSLMLPIMLVAAIFLWTDGVNNFFYSLGITIANPAYSIGFPIAGVLIFLGIVLQGPLRNFRINARRDVEYDEYGLSKSKGNYERLSKAERDAIDLQKTADMERLVNMTAIKKMMKKGPDDPLKELDEMIGLEPVKETVKEMVARMQFEVEENKKNKKKSKEGLSGRHMVFYGPPGVGKCQPLYSKVLTPTGFVKMGDIKVGDTVIAANGDYATVLGVFPQGKRKVYEMTLSDGSKCRSGDEHLWKVQTRRDRLEGKYRIVQTQDMLDDIYCKDEANRLNYSIQTVQNISMESKQFIVSPYIMGALIGDGSFRYRKGKPIIFSNADKEILDKINTELPNGLFLKKKGGRTHQNRYDYNIMKENDSDEAISNRKMFYNEIERLGLVGTYSHDKFIPCEYKYSSYEQRVELLRGLLDTDGSIVTTGAIRYDTASIRLANDVIELVRSLGGSAMARRRETGYKNNDGDFIRCRDSYVVTISFTDDIIPFALTRKAERITPNKFKHKFVQSIEYIGEEECQCIYIDHPSHLYVTDDYIVTHNTTIARILTSFLYKYGYIKENKCLEIDGNFLKAGTESAIKTEMILRHAYGGVLFIDEAYALMDSSDNSGEQVIATLIKQMEDQRGKFILILAGYTNEMRQLIDMNPGFESRIKEYLHFPDYTADEMRDILKYMAKKNNFTVDESAFRNYDTIVARERGLKSFGNARTVRNILDKAIDKHSLNIATGKLPPEKRYVLCDIDFQNLKLGGIGFENAW